MDAAAHAARYGGLRAGRIAANGQLRVRDFGECRGARRHTETEFKGSSMGLAARLLDPAAGPCELRRS